MNPTTNPLVRRIILFSVGFLLLLYSFLRMRLVIGPDLEKVETLYWVEVLLSFSMGALSLATGFCIRRLKNFSEIALLLVLLSTYFLLQLRGGWVLSGLTEDGLLSNVLIILITCVFTFAVPLLAAWVLGRRRALMFALLPAVMRVIQLYSAFDDGAAVYIVLYGLGETFSVAICVVEAFRLIGGGQLPVPLMLLSALISAFTVETLFSSLAVFRLGHQMSIFTNWLIFYFVPFILIHAAAIFNAQRKKRSRSAEGA